MHSDGHVGLELGHISGNRGQEQGRRRTLSRVPVYDHKDGELQVELNQNALRLSNIIDWKGTAEYQAVGTRFGVGNVTA